MGFGLSFQSIFNVVLDFVQCTCIYAVKLVAKGTAGVFFYRDLQSCPH